MENFHPRRILAATDFSDVSTNAMRFAVAIAQKFQSRISVIYAEPFLPPLEVMQGPVDFYFENIPEMKQALERRLLDYADTHIAGVAGTETDVVIDSPAGAIVSSAEKLDADLIVMGTHGRSGLRRALLGSVAESVVHETNRPVLTVRTADGGLAHEVAFRIVLCPVNFTLVARKALEHAAVISQAFDAKLIVLHVIERGEYLDEGEDLNQLRAWCPEDIQSLCEYRRLVLDGHAAGPIIDFAKSYHADLMVVGAQHRRFADTTVVGTTTERLIRHSPCPVLTVIRKVESRIEEEIQEPDLTSAR
jgi:Universal stress protein UspA and related nucleotide-binding proteins